MIKSEARLDRKIIAPISAKPIYVLLARTPEALTTRAISSLKLNKSLSDIKNF